MKEKNPFSTAAFMMLLMVTIFILPLNRGMAEEKGKPLVIGQSITFHSKVLNEDRQLWIHLPSSYDNSSTGYPVLYLLDGDQHFFYVSGYIKFFSSRDNMPEMIVVAIPNTDRTRDLLPVKMDRFPTSGGGDNFLKFLKEELFPYVEENYRTEPYRILAGHSMAGMFTVYTLFTAPGMFNAYIAASPALHLGDRIVFKKAESFFREQTAIKRFFFYTVGGLESESMIANARELERLLKEKAPAGLDWHFQFLEKDEHGTISHRSFCNGLETLYSGFLFPEADPSVQSLEGIKKYYNRLSEKYGYPVTIPLMILSIVGYDLVLQGKLDEAVKVLSFNAEKYPHVPNVYNLLGLAYEKGQQFELAKKNFEVACNMAEKDKSPLLKNFKRNLDRLLKTFGKK